MMKSLLLALCCLVPLSLASCSGPRSKSSDATVVTVGSLSTGARMAQVISDGRTWSVELGESDLTLTVNGVAAVFRDAKTGTRVNYQFDQVSSTWTFLLDGGPVHWKGNEVRVGDTTHDLSVPGVYDFEPADWASAE